MRPADPTLDDDEPGNSAEFWRMIRARRDEAAISWDEALKELSLGSGGQVRKSRSERPENDRRDCAYE
jgi:hypothetical protein